MLWQQQYVEPFVKEAKAKNIVKKDNSVMKKEKGVKTGKKKRKRHSDSP